MNDSDLESEKCKTAKVFNDIINTPENKIFSGVFISQTCGERNNI